MLCRPIDSYCEVIGGVPFGGIAHFFYNVLNTISRPICAQTLSIYYYYVCLLANLRGASPTYVPQFVGFSCLQVTSVTTTMISTWLSKTE